MELKQAKIGDVLIVSVIGELMGGADAEKFKALIFDAIDKEQLNLVVDLAGASWMNSSGLGMLVSGLTTIRSSGGDLRLANISERIRRSLEITRMDSIFQIYNSVDDAVNSFNR